MGNVIIAAASLNNVIGNKGTLPWRVPTEMKHFRQTTWGKMVVMGRKTFDSVGFLASRLNVILTSGVSPGRIILNESSNLYYASCFEDISILSGFYKYVEDIFIIGGQQVYESCLKRNQVDTILLSRIPLECEGDTFFPKIPKCFKLSSIIEKEGFVLEEYRKE